MKTENPWIGLKSYQEGQPLYGRNKEVLALSQCILNHPQTVVYGKSGIGKSSILEAGIFPVVRKVGVFPVRIRLDHNAEPYNQQIFKRVFEALSSLRKDNLNDDGERVTRFEKGSADELVPVIDPEKETLWEFFHRYLFLDENGERIIPMPVLDQFEEIFTLESDREKILAFFAELADLLNGVIPEYVGEAADDYEKYLPSSDFHLVITLREDFLSYLERYTEDIPCLKQNRFCLQPITEEQAVQIITRPIPGIASPQVAQTTLSKISGDGKKPGIARGQVDSAILSLYLNRLYDKMVENGSEIFTEDLIEAFGDHIIRDFYEECVAGIQPESIRYLEDRLVNAEGFRESVPLSKVHRDGIVSDDDVSTLKSRHLIHDFKDGNGVQRIEYVHDKICEVVQEIKRNRVVEERNRAVEERNRKLEKESKLLRAAAKTSRKRALVLGVISLLILGLSAFSIQRNAKLRRVNRELEERKEKIMDLMSGNVPYFLSNGDSYAAKRICLEMLHFYSQEGEKIPDSFRGILRSVASQEDAILRGHTGALTDVRFSPDGRYLATAGEDSTAMIWNVQNGEVVHKFADAGDVVLAVAFSPDGQSLVTGSRDGIVRLYDTEAGTLRWSSSGHRDWVRSVAFSPNGRHVVSASKDKTLKIWNAADGRDLQTIQGHRGEVLYVSFSPDGKIMATASADKTIRLWDAGSYSPLAITLSGHEDWVRSVEFHPDNVHLVSASDDKTVRVWDVRNQSQTILRRMTEYATRAVFSPDGERVVTSSRDGQVEIWKADGSESFRPKGKHGGWVNAVCVSPDGKRVASASSDMTARLIDLEPTLKVRAYPGHLANCSHLVSLPSGDAVSVGRDDKLFRWKADAPTSIWAVDGPRSSSLAVDPSGSVILTGHQAKITARSSEDGSILPISFEEARGWINAIAFSPDGTMVAGGSANGKTCIWNARQGGVPLSIIPSPVQTGILSLAFSPDGKTLAVGGEEGSIWLWNAVSPGESPFMTIIAHGDAVFSLSFSADGTRLLSSGKDKCAKIWNLADGNCLKVFSGFSGLVNEARFNGDESEIATMSSDHQLRIWSVASAQVLDEWTDPDGSLVVFDWTPDKQHIFTGSWDGTLALWRYPATVEIVKDLHARFAAPNSQSEELDAIVNLL